MPTHLILLVKIDDIGLLIELDLPIGLGRSLDDALYLLEITYDPDGDLRGLFADCSCYTTPFHSLPRSTE